MYHISISLRVQIVLTCSWYWMGTAEKLVQMGRFQATNEPYHLSSAVHGIRSRHVENRSVDPGGDFAVADWDHSCARWENHWAKSTRECNCFCTAVSQAFLGWTSQAWTGGLVQNSSLLVLFQMIFQLIISWSSGQKFGRQWFGELPGLVQVEISQLARDLAKELKERWILLPEMVHQLSKNQNAAPGEIRREEEEENHCDSGSTSKDQGWPTSAVWMCFTNGKWCGMYATLTGAWFASRSTGGASGTMNWCSVHVWNSLKFLDFKTLNVTFKWPNKNPPTTRMRIGVEHSRTIEHKGFCRLFSQ